MSKVDVLLGLQWGDEGKGKVVDVLTPNYDIVARFQGGPNAGHTIEFDGKHVVLRSVPSGVFNTNGVNIIGNGVVFDPILFRKEVNELAEYIPFDTLKAKIILSRTCHVITPFHKLQDQVNEAKKGENKVGTTGKGIGPTYTDKASRISIRLGELMDSFDETIFPSGFGMNVHNKLTAILKNLIDSGKEYPDLFPDAYLNVLKPHGGLQIIELLDTEFKEFRDACLWIKRNFIVTNTPFYINCALDQDMTVLAEGAQGTMLDIDHGTYPFVTSSNTTCGGVCSGLGIAPNKVGEVYGIFKAYCTRVGAGPFPTEDFGNDGEKICKIGHEFGAVTGRKRRCGWLDLVELKYACMINGVTQLIMMKSDVLSDFDEIKTCIAYQNKDEETTVNMVDELTDVKPIYKIHNGWKGVDLSKVTTYDDLPETFKDYVKYIEDFVKVPITIISVGPDRTQTIYKNK